MSLGLVWRACLAFVVGIALGLLGVRFIDNTGGSPPGAVDPDFISRLFLVRQANTGELISLQIGPFEVGQNDFRITLLNPLGKPQRFDSARLRFSRLESGEAPEEVDTAPAGKSRGSSFPLTEPGWWQIDVVVNTDSTASFYLKLDRPSTAPRAFAPPAYVSDQNAQRMFEAAIARYERLEGLRRSEELTSGDPGPSKFGVWFVTSIDANPQGFHATTVGMDRSDSSELFSDNSRQCIRPFRDTWQCTAGSAPIGPFDLGYLRTAIGLKRGSEEVIDGEMTQVIFFYNPSQGAWYAWWIGEETLYIRRQVMVANGHFMLDRFSGHDVPVAIQPKDLAIQSR